MTHDQRTRVAMDHNVRPGDQVLTVGILAGSGRVRLVLTGRLELAGVEALDSWVRLVERTELPFTIDCRQLAFIDDVGRAALTRPALGGATILGPQ